MARAPVKLEDREDERGPGRTPPGRPSPWRTFGLSAAWGAGLFFLALLVVGVPGGPGIASGAVAGLVAASALRAVGILRRRDERPWWLSWDVAGFVGSLSILALLAVTASVAVRVRGELSEAGTAAAILGGAGIAFSLAQTVALARADRVPARLIGGRLLGVWTDPPRGWSLFVLGAAVALPLVALHLGVLHTTDSGVLVERLINVQEGNLRFLVESQVVLLPHAVLAPLIALGGLAAANAFTIVSLQALAGVVSFIAWKLTRSVVGSLAAVLGLFALLDMFKTTALPMYPAMLFLGYLGAWAGYRAVMRHEGRWLLPFGSALLLVLAAESHEVGKVFLAVPLLLLILHHSRQAVLTVARIGLFGVVLSIPRVVINLAEGGLSHFLFNRSTWPATQGYQRMIGEQFRELPVNAGPLEYMGRFWDRVGPAVGWQEWTVILLALLAFLLARAKARWFGVACVTVLVGAFLYVTPTPTTRYLSPIFPGAAIATGVAVVALARRRMPWKPLAAVALPLAAVALSLLVAASSTTYVRMVHRAERTERKVIRGTPAALAARLQDGRRTFPGDERTVLGTKAHLLYFATTDAHTIGPEYLTEEEFVTFLSWPSDEEVLEVLRRHDVDWLVVRGRGSHQPRRFEAWLVPVYGRRVASADVLHESPNFCPVGEKAKNLRLFRVGPCRG